jgi:hypothetical protein
MTKYEEFYKDEQIGLDVTKQFVTKLYNSWKPTLQQILLSTNTLEEKLVMLLNTKQAQLLIQNNYMTESSLKGVLKKYIETPNDEWLKNRILSLSESSAIQSDLSEMRTPLSSVIPEKVLEYLPSKMVVDLDPEGKIVDIYSRYSNKDKNLQLKIQKQKEFIAINDRFVSLLDKGIRSTNKETRMMSLIIYIMYETGIRPGDDDTGLSKIYVKSDGSSLEPSKKEDKVQISVDTFGAINLKPEHFKVLDTFGTSLEFYGKSGIVNKATITNPLLNKVIANVIKRYKEGKALFGIDGKPYTSAQLHRFYLSLLKLAGLKNTDEHSMTDLRKLKSATVLHKALVLAEQQLHEGLLKIENVFSEKASKKIVEAISLHLKTAIENAKVALNHTTISMTINNYINPQVILNFLSNSGVIESDFSELLEQDAKVQFNIKSFLANAISNPGYSYTDEPLYPERDEFAREQSLLKFARVTNKKVLVVDRIEGNKAVFKAGRGTFIMPLMALPKGVKEGMRIEITLGGIPSLKKLDKKIKGLSSSDTGGDFSI